MSIKKTASQPGSPAIGYTAEDVNFGRFFKAATQTNKKVLKTVVMVMIYRARVAEVEVWPDNVAEYCFQILLWSKTKFRDNFQNEERVCLSEPFELADYDVSLITKMIHKLFSDMNLPESFQRVVRRLKNVRNRVCHEHEHLEDEQLTENLDELKTLFDSVLQETADFFSVDMTDLQTCYKEEVDEILHSSLPVDSTLYFESVEKFRFELVGRFITEGRREAMAQYGKLKTLNPFTWLSDDRFPEMTMDKIFTPLYILEKSRVVSVSSLLTTEIIDDKGDPTGMLPAVMVLTGVAGCGKTSLCRYLLHDWHTGQGTVDTLKMVDLVIFIEMRNVTSSSLVHYLCKTLLPETCSQFDEKDIICTLSQINILYVVDGMDEATTEGRKLVNDVLSILGNSRIIITTRPEFAYIINQMAGKYHHSVMKLANEGFSVTGIKTFTSHVFTATVSDKHLRREQECEFLKFLRTTGTGLADYLKLPLTVALLICLWKYDKTRISKVTSATMLYSEIIQLCSTKLISRLLTNSTFHELQFQSFMEEWLLALGRVAYEMLEEDDLVLTKDRQKVLISMCSARQIDNIQVFSAFLMCEVENSLLGIKYLFSFLHKSQMEYLAASYISQELTKGSKTPEHESVVTLLRNLKIFAMRSSSSCIKYGSSNSADFIPIRGRKWINTLTFVIGHLCMSKAPEKVIEELAENIVNNHSFNNVQHTALLWRLVQESDYHHLVCQMVGSSISRKIVWRPETEELCDSANPTYQLLLHTNFTPEKVKIRIVGSLHCINVVGEDGSVEQRCYDNLVPILERMSQMPLSPVALRCDQQFYDWGNPDTVDQLLLKLLPKGNLSDLMGHLGEQGAAVLYSITKVEKVQVRVSKPEVLHTLAKSLKVVHKKIEKVVLRLDIPSTVLPSALPTLSCVPAIVLHIRHVDDTNGPWAAEVLAKLSHSYAEVELLASSITLLGAQVFLESLVQLKVKISDSLTVCSTHSLEESDFKELGKKLKFSLHWWS